MSSKLYVGNLSYQLTNEELAAAFAQVGEVVSASIINDKFSGRSKGFGFVEMANEADAQKAIETLDNQELGGRPMKVSIARPPKQDRGGFNR